MPKAKKVDEPNTYRVVQKNWHKWSNQAQRVFNSVYDFMMENQPMMLHPKQDPPKPDHWKTTAWNAAWIAADAVDESLATHIDTAGDIVKVKTKSATA